MNGQVSLGTSRQTLAALGKYFVCTNPTAGSAIGFANNVAYSATDNGLFSIANSAPSGGPNIQLDRLKLIQTAAAPANGLYSRMEIVQETGIVVLSGNAAARTPVNINLAYTNATNATVMSFATGAGTVPGAVGTRRIIGVLSLASGVNVRYDSWTVEFGADGPVNGTVGLTAARATDPADLVFSAPPVTIAPQTSAWINLWGIAPDTNVPSYEWCLGWSEV